MTQNTLPIPKKEFQEDLVLIWESQIPENWKVKRLRFVASTLMSNVDKNVKILELPVRLCNYVDVYKKNFITDEISFMEATATKEEIDRFQIKAGDVLITKDSEDWRDIAVPALVKFQEPNLLCGYHLAILRTNRTDVTGHFLFWAILAQYNRIQFSMKANGITRYGISQGSIKDSWLLFPPVAEQTAIATFLDRKTAQIDRAVAIKEKQIALLRERKQILIQNAVTRGLDPDVPMRDSGVEWIGEIPGHWEVKRLKFFARIQNGQVDPKDKRFSGKTLIAPNHIESGTGRILFKESAFEQGAESGKYQAKKGNVIYCKIRPELRKACFVDEDCLCSADMYPITILASSIPKFLVYLLLEEKFSNFMVDQSMRVAMPKINRTDINNYYFPLPPLSEQAAIVAHIETQSQKIDHAIALQQQQIEKLKEYKATLINSAVTGKIRVPMDSEAEALPGTPGSESPGDGN
jgi:type I restriction enzyme S subunit